MPMLLNQFQKVTTAIPLWFIFQALLVSTFITRLLNSELLLLSWKDSGSFSRPYSSNNF